MILINARSAVACEIYSMVDEAPSRFRRETPEELRELATIYRGLAEVGATDQKNGRLRLANYLEEMAEIREAAIRRRIVANPASNG